MNCLIPEPAIRPDEAAPVAINPLTGRLFVDVVRQLHRVLEGDPVTEEMIVRFVEDRYEAPNLFYLPPLVAAEILRRPADFIRAAKQHCKPSLPF